MPTSAEGDSNTKSETHKDSVDGTKAPEVSWTERYRRQGLASAAELTELSQRMLDRGAVREDVAAEMIRRFGFGPLRAWRHAHGLTVEEVAARYNEIVGAHDQPMTGELIAEFENEYEFLQQQRRRPTADDLMVLAEIYGTTPEQLANLNVAARIDDRPEIVVVDWLPTSQPGHGPDPASLREHDISIYTTSEDGTRLQTAVLELLDIYGFDVTLWGPPQRGSWFRRLRVRSRDRKAVEKLTELAGKLERAAELKYIAAPRSESDEREAKAVAQLLQHTGHDEEVVICLSSVLFVRTRGAVVVKVLTEEEIRVLKDNPQLLRSPAEILDSLALLRQPVRGVQHGELSSAVPEKLDHHGRQPD